MDRLLQEGHDVVVVDNLVTGKRKNVPKAAQFYKLDIENPKLERVFRNERPSVVFHLAAQMNVRRSVEDPLFDAQVNVLGTLNVLEQASKHGARKVIFSSSGGAIYGEQLAFPAPETHVTQPLSPYGISKLCGEHYLSYYHRMSGIQVVSLRYANVYGPRQDPEGEAGVVAIFIQKMLRGEQAVVNGNGRQTRDHGRQHEGEGNERDIDHDQIDRFRDRPRFKIPDIGPFHQHNSWVLPEPPLELPIPHIDRIDAGCCPLQQTIGKTSGRTTDIQTDHPARIDPKLIQRSGQLFSAAPDIRRTRSSHLHQRLRQGRFCRLVDDDPVHTDQPGQDQTGCILPTGDETPADQGTIEPFPLWANFLGHMHEDVRR